MRPIKPVSIAFLFATLLAAPALAGGICGDVNDSGSVSASDALGVLKRGVGQDNVLFCAAPGQPARTGQFQDYGAGSDGDLQPGAPRTFIDNGDGTITDYGTGLMWEKKDRAGGVHDDLNAYTWSQEASDQHDGTIVTEFLSELNGGGGFAGYTDWRIPTRNELATLQNLATSSPSSYFIFTKGCSDDCTVENCGCLRSGAYWTSTTAVTNPVNAWTVGFFDSEISKSTKTSTRFSVAVRTASASPNSSTCMSPDPPQCAFGDPCTEGVCSITREPCGQQSDCPLSTGEQCCCSGICI